MKSKLAFQLSTYAVLYASMVFVALPAAIAGSSSLRAVINLAPVAGNVKIEREHKPYELGSTKLEAAFVGPGNGKDIRRVLFDPAYVAQKDGYYQDFWFRTFITAHGKKFWGGAACYWNKQKTLADCTVDCDGGSFQILTRRDSTGKSAEFSLRLTSETPSFRIAAEAADCEGEGAEYTLSLSGADAVSLPISLSPSSK